MDYTQWASPIPVSLDQPFLILLVYSLWIVVPTFIVAQLGKDLVASLNFADAQSKKISSGKKQ